VTVVCGFRAFCEAGHVESEMTQPAKTQEPSMEEILASIRRIISDDEAKPAAGAAPAAAPRPEPPAAKAPPTKAATALNPMPKAAAPRPPPPVAKNSQDEIDAMMAGFDGSKAASARADDDVFELTEQMAMPELPVSSFQHVEPDDDLEFTEGPAQRAAAPSFATASLPRAEMLSNTTVSAVESAFNALASTVLSNNARTLEDLVKEMLRPMLKSWLDDNLPNMVERIVKAEIERVSRGR
jgi:cell pole-organizing protein PopZ